MDVIKNHQKNEKERDDGVAVVNVDAMKLQIEELLTMLNDVIKIKNLIQKQFKYALFDVFELNFCKLYCIYKPSCKTRFSKQERQLMLETVQSLQQGE